MHIMNWSEYSSMLIVDLTIVGMGLVMLVVAVAQDMFKKGETPRTARVLVAGGVLVTCAYYLADLIALTVLPGFLDGVTATRVLDALQGGIRLLSTVISVALIVAGFATVAVQRKSIEAKIRSADARVLQAEASVAVSEKRFRSLIEQYTDPVYCFECRPPIDTTLPVDEQLTLSLDGVLVDCNHEFAKSLGADSRFDLMGTRLGDLNPVRNSDDYRKLFTAFVESGYALEDHALYYRTAEGEDRAIRVRFRGVVEDGFLMAAWGAEKNISATLQTEKALRSREKYQQVLAGISSRLLTSSNEDIESAIECSLRDVCRYLEAERATLIWFDKSADTAEVLHTWRVSGWRELPRISMQRFATLVQILDDGESLSFDSLDELPAHAGSDRASLEDLGVLSGALVPLIVDGEVQGSCILTNSDRERTWSQQDVADLQVIGELFSNAIFRQRSRAQLDRLLAQLESARDRLEAENVYLQQEILSSHGFNELVGESESLQSCLRLVAQVSATQAPVLLQGETGTGKELIARAIHEHGDRRDRPLVKINCAALPESLIESELFGHEAGAFTSARARKLGRFDLADKGTLFLDEIGDLPFELQGKLLRVLQDGEFQRLGGTQTVCVDVRIIAATNKRLRESVECGDFRADLFYRINTFPIELPPLRERQGDVALLAQHFVRMHAAKLGRDVTAIAKAMLDELESYDWPGNVRELESVIQRSLITSAGPLLRLDESLVKDPADPAFGNLPRRQRPADLRSAEREHICEVLDATGWRISGESGAAKRLGLPPSTLRSRMKKLGIVRRATA